MGPQALVAAGSRYSCLKQSTGTADLAIKREPTTSAFGTVRRSSSSAIVEIQESDEGRKLRKSCPA
jgi:hypothetical protein